MKREGEIHHLHFIILQKTNKNKKKMPAFTPTSRSFPSPLLSFFSILQEFPHENNIHLNIFT